MFIDIHVHPHFYAPINEEGSKLALRHRVMDIHHNGTPPLEHIFNQMRCAGLDVLCLLAQDYTTQAGDAPVTNEEIRRLVDLAPDRFIGFASVDPYDEKAVEKLERAFCELGLWGLKLHPSRQGFYPDDGCVQPLYEICERYDKPVLFHAGLSWEPDTLTKYAHPLAFEELAMHRPALRIALAHFGWPWVRETAMLMLKYSNVYTDTGLLYFDSAREFYAEVMTRQIPATWIDRSLRHQVMFGSNNPRFEQIRMAGALETLGFRDSTLDLIRGQNALDFLRATPGEGGR